MSRARLVQDVRAGLGNRFVHSLAITRLVFVVAAANTALILAGVVFAPATLGSLSGIGIIVADIGLQVVWLPSRSSDRCRWLACVTGGLCVGAAAAFAAG